MRADAIVEDEVFSEFESKESKIMYHPKVLGYELILDCSVIALHTTVNLRAPRVTETMLDLESAKVCVELAEEL
jgi:hypothetical protein